VSEKQIQVLSMLEKIYSRIKYLEKKKKFKECKRSDQRIWERVLTRSRRCNKTRIRKRSIWKGRITRKVYSKKTTWIVR